MDYETLHVLYKSRQTLLKILAARGYETKKYEKFGPVEISAMAAAGAGTFQMDLERPAEAATTQGGMTKCRVVYSINRIKNRINSFLEEQTEEDNETSVDPASTELIVILLEPIVEAFHIAAMTALASKKLRVSFFQAHTIVNNPFDHVLVPKHEFLPASEHAEFLSHNRIKSKATLPLIKFHSDMIARLMGLLPGDIVKITRPSPSAGEYITYRVCAP
jgi:DNA-directed RNA polymerase I, II, and III subunit RPABC1